MENTELPAKVLLVEDDVVIAEHVCKQLERHKVRVIRASALDTAQYHFNSQKFDMAIVELDFKEMPGMGLIQKWLQHPMADKRKTGFIISSGSNRTREEESLIKEIGSFEVVNKPLTAPGLIRAMVNTKSKMENEKQYENLEKKIKRMAFETKDYTMAELSLQKVLHTKNFGLRPLELLCMIYTEQARFDRVLEVCKKVLDSEPDNLRFMNIKAAALIKMNHLNEASLVYERADKIAPMNLTRVAHMAALYMDLQKPSLARSKYQSLAMYAEDPISFINETVDRFIRRGFDEDAKKMVAENNSAKEVIRYYNNKGVVYAKQGRHGEAQEEYFRALRLFENTKESSKLYFNLALSFLKQKAPNSKDRSLEFLDKAIAIEMNFEKAKDLRKRIKQKT